jgi:hypothetical protein
MTKQQELITYCETTFLITSLVDSNFSDKDMKLDILNELYYRTPNEEIWQWGKSETNN